MATTRNGVVLFLSALLAMAWAYPTTVPPSPEVCSKMTPGHGPSAQTSASPYTVTVSGTDVKGGSVVQVTLDGNGHNFKGFYMQARDDSGTRVGTFIPDDGIVKVHGCGGIKNNGAHHSGKDDKSSVLIHWKAPEKYNGKVTFVTTIVEEFETFWTNVRSEPISISFSKLDITSNPPAFTDSREKRATPEATQEGRILNYNPYSPYSPLKNEDFKSHEFLHSSPILNHNEEDAQETFDKFNQSFTRRPRPASKRRRKSYYIPQPQPHDDINDGVVDNCEFHHTPSGGGGSGRPVPVRYTYMRGQSPVTLNFPVLNPQPHPPPPTVVTSPGPVKGGFHYLDDSKYDVVRTPRPQFGIVPTSSRKVKFFDDIAPSRQHFPASYYPPSDIVSSYGFNRGPSSFYSKPEQYPSNYFDQSYLQDKPTYSGGSGWSQIQPQPIIKQHGTIVSDYGVIDTAIVLPKDMQSFELPRYGYLVYNPKRGPPFYIIPAETEAFENAHFDLGRSKKQ